MQTADHFAGLGHREPWRPIAGPTEPTDQVDSRTAQMRKALAAGPMTGAELGQLIERDPARVRALLKQDIARGRVVLADGVYSLNADYDDSERADIAAAIRLLSRHGYVVRKAARALSSMKGHHD